jgi:hypothetical protein
MPQIFHPSTNTIAKLSIVAVVLGVPTIGVASYAFNLSYGINLNVPLDQPVQFSHKHHVGDDGIDCRYCHTSVEKSAYAGVPPTETCMTCHSQLWSESPLLEPVRESYRTGRPIQWERVHDLPDFAFFNHSIHLKKGIGCVSCHGRVDEMPITRKHSDLSMRWCLDCHRNPEPNLRPQSRIFDLAWKLVPSEREGTVTEVIQESDTMRQIRVSPDVYNILGRHQMTNCSTCHR